MASADPTSARTDGTVNGRRCGLPWSPAVVMRFDAADDPWRREPVEPDKAIGVGRRLLGIAGFGPAVTRKLEAVRVRPGQLRRCRNR